MTVAVHDAQQQVGDRAVLSVREDEYPAGPLEDGEFLDGAWVVVGDRVHAEVAEEFPGRPLDLDEER